MERKIGFYSDGLKIAGVLYEPEEARDKSCLGIVLCQGMIGIKEYFWFPQIAQSFADLGCVALIWDYRGVGESEGERGRLYPLEQADDIRNALTYLQAHAKVDPERLAIIGWEFRRGHGPVRGRGGRTGQVRRQHSGLGRWETLDAECAPRLRVAAAP